MQNFFLLLLLLLLLLVFFSFFSGITGRQAGLMMHLQFSGLFLFKIMRHCDPVSAQCTPQFRLRTTTRFPLPRLIGRDPLDGPRAHRPDN